MVKVVWVALAACGEPDEPPPVDGGQTPTPTPPVHTTDTACLSDAVLVGTLGQCDDAFPACGGDLTGAWIAVDWCSDEGSSGTATYVDEACVGDVRTETLRRFSTVNFEADGTFQNTVVLDSDLLWTLPPGCLDELGYAECDEFQPGTFQLDCTTQSDGGCTCVSSAHVTVSGDATWSACDGRLTVSEIVGTLTGTVFGSPTTTTTTLGPFETDYCIDGAVLRVETDPYAEEFAGLYERP